MDKRNAELITARLSRLIGSNAIALDGNEYIIIGTECTLLPNSENSYQSYITLKHINENIRQVRTEPIDSFQRNFFILGKIEIRIQIVNTSFALALYSPENFVYNHVNFETSAKIPFSPKSIYTLPSPVPGMKCEIYQLNNELKRNCKVMGGDVKAVVSVDGLKYVSNNMNVQEISKLP